MNTQEGDMAWRNKIIAKVKARSSTYKVLFHKAHPISYQLHPDYPSGYFIELKFMSNYRYSNTPSHLFMNETELDRFLNSYT